MTSETIEVNDNATTTVNASHDSFFKASMQHLEIARDFLKAYLPDVIVQQVQFDTLELMSNSFINNQHQTLISDMLYSVQIEKQAGYIYMLIEHQSKPLRLMPYRILKYMLAICDEHLKKQSDLAPDKKKLPIIVPLVFYTGKRSPYPYDTNIYSCFENPELAKKVLFEPFQLIDLSKVSDDILKSHGHAAVMELLAKHVKMPDIFPLFESMQKSGLLKQVSHIGAGEYWQIVLKYVLDKGETSDVQRIVKLLAEPDIDPRGDTMTIAEALRQQGMQQGEQKGEHKKAEKVAIRLLAKGLDCEEIADITDLSLDEVRALEAANH